MTIKYNCDNKYRLICDSCNKRINDSVYSKNGNEITSESRIENMKTHFHEECY